MQFSAKKFTSKHKMILLMKTWNYFITDKEVKIIKYSENIDNKVIII